MDIRKLKLAVFPTLLITILSPTISYAQSTDEVKDKNYEMCRTLMLTVADKMKLKDVEESNETYTPYQLNGVVDATCQRLPNQKNNFVIALATYAKNEYTKDLTIAVVDSKNEKIISSYRGTIEEDATLALEKGSLRVDTANYRLNDTTRAFGLDIKSAYLPSCAEGGFGTLRTLYIQDGNKIRPILENIYLTTWHYIQEGQSRCNSDQNLPEEPIIATFKATISIGRTMSHGYKDILINMSSSRDDGGSPPVKPETYKISYSGKKYLIDPSLVSSYKSNSLKL